MGEIYDDGTVMRELARILSDYFNQASGNLSYAKGYTGLVIKAQPDIDTYFININGVNYKVHTTLPLQKDDSVPVISLQNRMSDYLVVPTPEMISRMNAARESYKYGDDLAHSSGYVVAKINSKEEWSLSFEFVINHSSGLYDVRIKGTNNGSSRWSGTAAYKVCGASFTLSLGYDANGYLWVAAPAANYIGAGVFNITNGQAEAGGDLFTVYYSATLPGTVQTTITV